jgi:AraC family transcriptional regulator of adaptative response / DNA-3-methyladenine glycosylase II
LTYRAPYDWDAMLAFLAARAIPGIESVEHGRYRRTIALDGRCGSIDVGFGDSLEVKIDFPDSHAAPAILDRVRRIFDTDADPAAITRVLGADPLLRDPLARHRGIRVPGAWDPFELAVRAILGQQVSVRAASTIAGRIVSMFGSPFTPERLADAPLERCGVMPSRAETIRALARRWDGAALDGIPGIGPWTRQYIAMRAFNDPDAFPAGDLILRRKAGVRTARELEERSQAWRPWRAYAVMLLWISGTGYTTSKLRRE